MNDDTKKKILDNRVKNLKTPEDCERFAKNALNNDRADLAQEARRKAVSLRTEEYGANTDVERECLEALFAYEAALTEKNGKPTKANRTWPKIKEVGIIQTVEDVVNRKKESVGYTLLVDMGLEDYSFEAVVVKFPESFSAETLVISNERIKKWDE